MDKLNELRIINDSNITYLKKLNLDYQKYDIIQNILKDDACFFKITQEEAYILLKDLGIVDSEMDNIYKELISNKYFNNLVASNIIDINDNDLVISYPSYGSDNLFKNRGIDIKAKETERENIESLNIISTNKESLIKKIIKKLKSFFK